MTQSRPGAIVFDLDGTLIDSAPDLHAALNKVLDEEGASPVTLTETMSFIGHGIPNLVREARVAKGIDPKRQEEMTRSMYHHYLVAPSALSRPYPGAVDCLTSLQALGHPIGLCTNKALEPTMAILEALDLRRFFSTIIGGDSMAEKKPDPKPLLAAFDGLGLPFLYVGDSEVDAATAEAAGIPFALHTHGYRKSPLAEITFDFAFDRYADLPARIARRLREGA